MLDAFDTAILNGRCDLFRPTVFRTLWSQMDDATTPGRIGFFDEVQRELTRRDNDGPSDRWGTHPHQNDVAIAT